MMDSCDLMSFLPLFQSHQNAYGDNECLCAMESHLLLKKKIPASAGMESGTARSVG